MTDDHTEPRYTTEELADMLRVDASSVRRWRTAEPLQGPPFIRVSARRTLYLASDVAAWLDQRESILPRWREGCRRTRDRRPSFIRTVEAWLRRRRASSRAAE